MSVFDLGDLTTLWPATTSGSDLPPQLPPGPWQPRTDPDLPVAVDPALNGWEPPTLDDLGLTAHPVAQVLRMRAQIGELIAGMTDQQRADLAQYEQQQRHLKAVS